MAKKPKKKRPQKTTGKYKSELDAVFSQWVRKGATSCYTFGRTGVTLQNGHFVSRKYLATRWEPDNCRPQCVGCNLFNDGATLDFEERLIADLGLARVQELKQIRHKILKLSIPWYQEQIEKYKSLLTT